MAKLLSTTVHDIFSFLFSSSGPKKTLDREHTPAAPWTTTEGAGPGLSTYRLLPSLHLRQGLLEAHPCAYQPGCSILLPEIVWVSIYIRMALRGRVTMGGPGLVKMPIGKVSLLSLHNMVGMSGITVL